MAYDDDDSLGLLGNGRNVSSVSRHHVSVSNTQAGAPRRRPMKGAEAAREFSSLGEFFQAVRFNRNDQRLTSLFHERADEGEDGGPRGEMRTDDGASGGFAIPVQFRDELLRVNPTAAVMRPRSLVLPAGDAPDGGLDIPALDQSASTNMYAGVTVGWIGEGGLKPDTTAKIRQISLRPQEVAATIKVTDKLLRNWSGAGQMLGDLLRSAMAAAEDVAFLMGNGVAKPVGCLNATCRIEVSRTNANQVSYSDVLAMDETLLGVPGSAAFWTCSRRTLTQLRQLKNPAGYFIWQPNARDGAPGKLLGHDVVVSDRVPELGSRGDLMLIDGSKYVIKDGSGPFVAISEHVYFETNESVIKAFWNVDGQPWVKDPVKTENSDLESPIVVLN